MDLKEISTTELVKELESREGVEKITVGPDDSYSYRKKYDRRRHKLEPGTILLALVNETPDSSSKQG